MIPVCSNFKIPGQEEHGAAQRAFQAAIRLDPDHVESLTGLREREREARERERQQVTSPWTTSSLSQVSHYILY